MNPGKYLAGCWQVRGHSCPYGIASCLVFGLAVAKRHVRIRVFPVPAWQRDEGSADLQWALTHTNRENYGVKRKFSWKPRW